MFDLLNGYELDRAIAHARNKRDAYSYGRVPVEVMAHLNALLDEQRRRREAAQFQNALTRLPLRSACR